MLRGYELFACYRGLDLGHCLGWNLSSGIISKIINLK